MKVKVTIESQAMSKEEVRLLIQSIRDCEKKYFPKKQISLWVEVPDLTRAECIEILASIKPPINMGQ